MNETSIQTTTEGSPLSPTGEAETKASIFDKIWQRLASTGISVSFRHFHLQIPSLDLTILTTATCITAALCALAYMVKKVFG